MSKLARPPHAFGESAGKTLADPVVIGAIAKGTERAMVDRLTAWGEVAQIEALRETASRIRSRTIADLPRHLETFADAVESRGGHVHWAADAQEACDAIAGICKAAGAKLVAKSKSMASEEIGLNARLLAEGIRPVETDLGEYLLQLAGQHPTHIIAPAMELTKERCAELLSAVDGAPVEPEHPALMAAARRQLREAFLAADVGITGANFGVAETGSIVLVTNEGNGRLVTALPRVHIAILGMERLVPTTAELAPLLQLLGRSGTGQRLTVYTTVLSPPRREGEEDGPEEFHVVVLDNGRSNLLEGRYREMLNCIRCGACLNVCPVYRKTGGNAYGPVYSGPMGAVLVPLLVGLGNAPELPHASSLCGACTAACPVKIPLHELLVELRRDLVDREVASRRERLAMTLWSYAWSSPLLYRLSTFAARLGQPFGGALGPGKAWASGRELPRLQRKRYRDRR